MSANLDHEALHAVFCVAFGLPASTVQSVIAERLGVQQTLYSRIIRGDRASMRQLAKHLRRAGRVDLAKSIEHSDAKAAANFDEYKIRRRRELAEEVNVHILRDLETLTS